MDIHRTKRDLSILKAIQFKGATWTFNTLGYPDFIKAEGVFDLNPDEFSLRNLNILVPVPSNLYDPAGDNRFYFYQYVYIDDSLRIRDRGTGKWRSIRRSHASNIHTAETSAPFRGWQWICVMHPTCGPRENILDLFASVQTYLNNDA